MTRKTTELDATGRPTPSTVMYGKSLQRNLVAAQKRRGMSSNPKQEQRDIEDAQLAIRVHDETMDRLLRDCQDSPLWVEPAPESAKAHQ